MKAIIPTGGRGTRMQPITFSINKHFIPVANKPLVFYPIEAIADTGIKEVAITYNPGWLKYVKEQLGTGRKWGLKFTYILQEKPLGLAHIVQVCEEYLDGKEFVLHLGDNIFSEGIVELVRYFQKEKPNGLLAMVHSDQGYRLGVPYFDKKGRLTKYVEKPKNPPHKFIVPGVYFGDKNFFKSFRGKDKITPSARGELEIPYPFQWMIDHGYRVDVKEYKGKWLDPGKFGDWIESNRYLLDNKLETDIKSKSDKNSKVEGRVQIGRGCKINGSEIKGPVAIGNNVSIINSYIGPYASISDGCVVKNSHVENSVLMEKVKVVDLKQPMDESLIGAETEIIHENGPTDWLKLFVGEKSKIKI